MTDIQDEISKLKASLKQTMSEKEDVNASEYLRSQEQVKLERTPISRHILKGHIAKVAAVSWTTDPKYCVSVGQDAQLLVWDCVTTNKVKAGSLDSSWMITVNVSPAKTLVGAGGLDNACNLFTVIKEEAIIKPLTILRGHTGFLSGCRFIDDSQVLTSSGDQTCVLWDIPNKKIVHQFFGHASDVNGISLSPTNNTQFASASADSSARVWDVRSKKCEGVFKGHQSDVNCVQYCRNGYHFATGADDGLLILWDTRYPKPLVTYKDAGGISVTSLDFSLSGAYIFSGFDDFDVGVWNCLTGELCKRLSGHENVVSSLGVNEDGSALCTGSWDFNLRIWA